MISFKPLSPAWQAYYDTLDPEARRELLESNLLEQEDDGANAFRGRLYFERYRGKGPEGPPDLFLRRCLYLPALYQKRNDLFSGFRKEVRKTLSLLHLDAPESLEEAEQSALYWEFRNVGRRYLETCKNTRYGKKLMGLADPTPEEKRNRICGDIWMMSRGIAIAAGREEQMLLLCDAFREELLRFDPQCREFFERAESRQYD